MYLYIEFYPFKIQDQCETAHFNSILSNCVGYHCFLNQSVLYSPLLLYSMLMSYVSVLSHFSHVRLCVTLWTTASHVPYKFTNLIRQFRRNGFGKKVLYIYIYIFFFSILILSLNLRICQFWNQIRVITEDMPLKTLSVV